MSDEKKFVQGMWLENKQSKYGTFKKCSLELDTFAQFVKDNQVTDQKTGKRYLNFDIFESKEGKPFAVLNEFKPEVKNIDDRQDTQQKAF